MAFNRILYTLYLAGISCASITGNIFWTNFYRSIILSCFFRITNTYVTYTYILSIENKSLKFTPDTSDEKLLLQLKQEQVMTLKQINNQNQF